VGVGVRSGKRVLNLLVGAILLAAVPLVGPLHVSASNAPAAHLSAAPAAPSRSLTAQETSNHSRPSPRRAGAFGVHLVGNGHGASGATAPHRRATRMTTPSKSEAATPLVTSVAPTVLSGFQAAAQATDIQEFGNDQGDPADPDIATGPSDVVETVLTAMNVYDRAGDLLDSVDLGDFLNRASGDQINDPRVIYDPSSGRFWLTAAERPNLSCSAGSTPVLLAVSGSSNPLPFTSWLVYNLPFVTAGTAIGLEPGLGASSSTVAVTFGDLDCNGNWLGSDIDILQKTDYERNTGSRSDDVFTDDEFVPQPAQSYGPTTTQYVVANDSDCGPTVCTQPAIGVSAYTGTPEDSGGVHVAYSLLAMDPTAVDDTTGFDPPAPEMGASITLQTDDDRFLNAVWEGGKLWTADGTTCTPSGDTAPRSCLNFVDVTASSTGVVSPSITQINNQGISGTYLFYPEVTVDGAGDMFTVFVESSSSTFPSIVAAAVPAGGSALSAFRTVHTSAIDYIAQDGCTFGAQIVCPFGDYSGAAQDPLNPTDVWVVAQDEDDLAAACGSQTACWNTDIGLITLAKPAITSLTPASGPVAGGQTVTVHGNDFASDTVATFGGATLSIGNLSLDSFTFVTPPTVPAGGTVQVQATDSIGSSTEDAASLYTYTGLANYVPLTPYRILDTRVTGGALGPGGIRSLQVTGVGSSPIPPTATAAVLNVTEVSGSALSLLTVFPFNTSRPNASNLNFTAHTVIANLVTVTLGAQSGQGWVNIYNALGSVNVLVDVEGYFTPDPASDAQGLFHPIAPVRVCDTRRPSPTPACSAHGALGPEAAMVVTVSSAGGIPSDASAEAAVVNLTGVAGTAPTYLSVFPTNASGGCTYTGTHAPPFSTINLAAGAVAANRVMVELGPASSGGNDDALCVYNAAGTINVLIDANGWYGSATAPGSPAGFQYQAIAPTRICDTRSVSTSCLEGAVGAARSVVTPVAGDGEIPAVGGSAPVVAVIANLTAVAPTQTTFLTLYPANLLHQPTVSDLNLGAGAVLPNLAVVELDTTGDAHDGDIYLYNSAGSVNAIIDIEGWFQ
jgi:hypothetical protein